ncbi:MAG: carbohydrate binding domain-containing protein [Lachnospiraceae bacterium]|nr:carbohydrate binding domain-containing protein [Lachnospiraceae bacterium]
MMKKKVIAAVVAGMLITTMFTEPFLGSTEQRQINRNVAIGNWTFVQGGKYCPEEPGNEGYIGNVKMQGTDEELADWLNDDNIAEHSDKDISDSVRQTFSATKASNGFTMSILNTGWDAIWTEDVEGVATKGVVAQDILAKEGKEVHVAGINPWSVQAKTSFEAKDKYEYTVSFKAKASKKKYAQVTFTCGDKGAANGEEPIIGQNLLFDNNNIIELETKEKEYTFRFTNWVGGDTIDINFLLGAFDASYDQAGVPIDGVYNYNWEKIADFPKVDYEMKWMGKVIISDLVVIEEPGYIPPTTSSQTPPPTTTVAPTTVAPTTVAPTTVAPTTKAPETTTAATTVAKAKIASAKKSGKKIKLTIKKVANAKTYEIKYGTSKKFKKGTKTLKTTKVKVTLKKIAKKVYYIKVRAIAADGTAGAISLTLM